jgi:hypothetical protein
MAFSSGSTSHCVHHMLDEYLRRGIVRRISQFESGKAFTCAKRATLCRVTTISPQIICGEQQLSLAMAAPPIDLSIFLPVVRLGTREVWRLHSGFRVSDREAGASLNDVRATNLFRGIGLESNVRPSSYCSQ